MIVEVPAGLHVALADRLPAGMPSGATSSSPVKVGGVTGGAPIAEPASVANASRTAARATTPYRLGPIVGPEDWFTRNGGRPSVWRVEKLAYRGFLEQDEDVLDLIERYLLQPKGTPELLWTS